LHRDTPAWERKGKVIGERMFMHKDLHQTMLKRFLESMDKLVDIGEKRDMRCGAKRFWQDYPAYALGKGFAYSYPSSGK